MWRLFITFFFWLFVFGRHDLKATIVEGLNSNAITSFSRVNCDSNSRHSALCIVGTITQTTQTEISSVQSDWQDRLGWRRMPVPPVAKIFPWLRHLFPKHLVITNVTKIFLFAGIHFDVDMERVLQNFVSLGLKVFFHAVDSMLEKNGESSQTFNSEKGDEKRLFDYDLNCQGVNSNHRWENGPQFYRFAQLKISLNR